MSNYVLQHRLKTTAEMRKTVDNYNLLRVIDFYRIYPKVSQLLAAHPHYNTCIDAVLFLYSQFDRLGPEGLSDLYINTLLSV